MELYLAIAMLIRRYDFELYNTIRKRDVDFHKDAFVGEFHPQSQGIRVKVVGVRP